MLSVVRGVSGQTEPTGYGEETNQDIKQGKRDWALIYKLLTMEQRGELLATSMLVGFYNSPFGGQRMVHATLGTERGERTTHASGRAGPE